MVGFPWEENDDFEKTAELAVYLRDKYQLPDANFFVVKVYPSTRLCNELNTIRAKKLLTPSQIYDTKSVRDWDSVEDERVAAKLSRFNDIPAVSTHPRFSSTALRRIARNAYEIFFDKSVHCDDIKERLWIGVP